MCGIFGILHDASVQLDSAVLEAAALAQAHRGPDSRRIQTFQFARSSLVLAHQRLSIIDLTEAAHQPMGYHDGRGSLIYNGELYNYLELRADLARGGERFTTRSDTEVLLAALHHWGPETALSRFNWMGAFAWVDRTAERLVLACDAGSEKPLYYYVDDHQFAFASEIKTLLTLLGRKFSLDRDTVGQFIFQGLSDTSTRTFFRGITRLEAGTYLELALAGDSRGIEPVRYEPPSWAGEPAHMSLEEFINELRRTFIDSVRVRLRSDVPVGVLLSGGIDSSSIAAIAQMLIGRESAPRLLSAISDDRRFDEAIHIDAMERHLEQTAHRITLRTAPERLLADLSTVNWYNDAPVAGLSALGHYRLMERAKELGLTVILSGQGADEILLGYRKFLGFYLQSLLRHGQCLKAAGVLARFMINRTVVNQIDASDAKRYVPILRMLSRAWNGDESETATEGAALKGWKPMSLGLGSGSLADRQRLDLRRYSVPSLCHYEDRMSMAMSREIRLPFLDSRLVDLLIRAPDDYKLRNGWTKYSFRKAMEGFLPPEIAWRKDKRGFSNPQGEWLKHELQGPVRDAFSADSLVCQKEIVNGRALLRKYDQYRRQPVRGGMIWYREIFAPFSLELWMRRYEAWIE
jgi:asparagine synthase (glutamine-hydrolysing)